MVKVHSKKTTEKPNREASKRDLEIAAYYRWLERGAPPNDELDDWVAVENKWRDNIVPSRND